MPLADTLDSLIHGAKPQIALPAEGDQIVMREADTLMRPRPLNGPLELRVGSTLQAGLILEESAYVVLCLVEPTPQGERICTLLQGSDGAYDGTREVPATDGWGEDSLHVALDAVNEEILVETPGLHVILALIADQPVPAGINDLAGSDEYWSRIGIWVAQAGVKGLRREFLGK